MSEKKRYTPLMLHLARAFGVQFEKKNDRCNPSVAHVTWVQLRPET